MEPNDDPEARTIEHRLPDAAQTSEGTPQSGGYVPPPTQPPWTSGAPPSSGYQPPPTQPPWTSGAPPSGGYQPPPTQPPGTYGAPPSGGYQPPPTQPPGTYGTAYSPPIKSGRSAGVWIVLGLIAVGAVALLVGIVVFGLYVFHRGASSISSPALPSTSRSSAYTPSIPTALPGIPTAQAPTSSSTPPGGKLTVNGSNVNKTLVCNDNSLLVNGNSNTVVVTGHCTKVTVNGIKNVVTLDSADTINVNGLNNQVTYHSGSPEIENPISSNTVQQG